MTNITMLVHNRPRITAQAIDSLYNNTPNNLFKLHLLDDASDEETSMVLKSGPSDTLWRNEISEGTGIARTRVISQARAHEGDFLYLSDNDVYFKPNWLAVLLEMYDYAREDMDVVALGAYLHPYNLPYKRRRVYSTVLGKSIDIGLVQALSTQSWLWTWKDWDRFGPFVDTPVGKVRCSEDVEMSNRIRAAGKHVAVIIPPMIVNTGRKDSFGECIPGYDCIANEAGIVMEEN